VYNVSGSVVKYLNIKVLKYYTPGIGKVFKYWLKLQKQDQ